MTGGCYDVGMFANFDEDEETEFICPIGHGMLKGPVSLPCGHTFCQDCITAWYQKNKTCPIDRIVAARNKFVQNRLVQSLIEKKKVSCCRAFNVQGSENTNSKANQTIKCDWQGQLQQLLAHRQKECGSEIVGCKNDGCTDVDLTRRDAVQHSQSCLYRIARCEMCGDGLRFMDKQKHEEICPEKEVKCQRGCESLVKKKNFKIHMSNECGETIIDCPSKEVGCNTTFKRRELDEHLKQNMVSHFLLMNDTIKQLKKELEAAKKRIKSLEEESGTEEDTPQKPNQTKTLKNPIEQLPPTSFTLDVWKRIYSNNDSPVSIVWFFENIDIKGWSVYFSEYKYPQEQTVLFKVCNLIGGFIQRLDSLQKYGFGSIVILEVEKKRYFEVHGAWLFRGQDIPSAMTNCIDSELYTWKKADLNNNQDQKKIDELFSWQPNIPGRKFVQGKVFK